MKMSGHLTRFLVLYLIFLTAQARAVSSLGQSHDDFDMLQELIQFDCLDGVAVNPANGAVRLYGHRVDTNRIVHIPYLDFLATALACKEPTFSLEWTDSSRRTSTDALRTCANRILSGVTKIFDKDQHLTSGGAWLLRQGGADVKTSMDAATTLVQLLRTKGRASLADIVRGIRAWDNSGGFTSPAALELYRALGVDGAWNELMKRRAEGRGSPDEARDQFYVKLL